MAERVIEIIMYVMTSLKQKKKINDKYINELKKKGYTSSEISTAFSWIAEKESPDSLNVKLREVRNQISYRLLHDNEKELFTKEAYGLLIQFQCLGLIESHHVDMMIERSLLFGFQKIEGWQVKAFVAALLYNERPDSAEYHNKFMLSGNERIN